MSACHQIICTIATNMAHCPPSVYSQKIVALIKLVLDVYHLYLTEEQASVSDAGLLTQVCQPVNSSKYGIINVSVYRVWRTALHFSVLNLIMNLEFYFRPVSIQFFQQLWIFTLIPEMDSASWEGRENSWCQCSDNSWPLRTYFEWVCLVMLRMVLPSLPIIAPTNCVGTIMRSGMIIGSLGRAPRPGEPARGGPRAPKPLLPPAGGPSAEAVSSGM